MGIVECGLCQAGHCPTAGPPLEAASPGAFRIPHARPSRPPRVLPRHAGRCGHRAPARPRAAAAAFRRAAPVPQQASGRWLAPRAGRGTRASLPRRGRAVHRERRRAHRGRREGRWRAPRRARRRDFGRPCAAGRTRPHRRLLLRRCGTRRRGRTRRRRLPRVRRVLPLFDQAQRTPRNAAAAARRTPPRPAAGGDRRHHAGQCTSPDRSRRRPAGGGVRRLRRPRPRRRRAPLPIAVRHIAALQSPAAVRFHEDLMDTRRSQDLFRRAQSLMPGGVNSPVRAFKSVGGEPFFVQRAEGAHLIDVDGNRYIDYVGSWGPMIVGHNHPAVLDAVIATARDGLSFGTPNPLEVTMAETIARLVPSCEMVRMVNSGTEATLSAIRLARGATGRARIVKFEGCYHGHGDSFLVKAGSGALTFGVPTSPGVPKALADLTLTLPYNDFDAATALFDQRGDAIAGLIIEPVVGNANCLPPRDGFLQHLRDLCTQYGALLIFDEVMTGFRVALGGAQARYGVTPDLSTFGKIIGGGMPVGAYGGRRDLMQQIAPSGPIYQAGTLSGNPVAMAAGLATLELVQAPGFYESLEARANQLCDGFEAAAREAGVPLTTNRSCAMFGLFFTDQKVESFTQATQCDVAAFRRFFHAMLRRGVYLAPSAYEAGFLSSAHGDTEIAHTLEAAREAFREVGN